MFDKIPAIIDIETNVPKDEVFKDYGQLAMSEITHYCVKVKGPKLLDGGETWSSGWRSDTLRAVLTSLILHKTISPETHAIVGHNIIRFDLPIIKRVEGIDLLEDFEIYDTLLMSKISEYGRMSHSLESYAAEAKIEKLDMSDLQARCNNDVLLTEWLFHKLVARKKELDIPDNPYKVEFRVAEIIARQHAHGVLFDTSGALDLKEHMRRRAEELEALAEVCIPMQKIPESKQKKPPKIQFKKNGDISEAFDKYLKENNAYICVSLPSGERSVETSDGRKFPLPLTEPLQKWQHINLRSSSQVKEWLLSEGWVPTLWNYKRDDKTGRLVETSPKLYDENKELCPALEAMKIPGVEYISEYLNLSNRLSIIDGWLNNCRVKDDSMLSPDADTCGAVTHRFTHRIVANVPRVTSEYGKEIRALFIPRYFKVMVGWDAKALEARMEAHYTHKYDPDYSKELLEGDVHTKNMVSLGLPNRDKSKTFKYAATYGAGPTKLARTFGWNVVEATRIHQKFWKTNKALAQLRDDCALARDRGFIRGLDGRPIAVDSPHSALNRLLQSAGAIVMKYAMVIADRDIRKLNLDADGLIRYHDEEQWEVHPSVADKVGRIGVESIRKAGRYLKLNVPLDGEYKIGHNWSETH